MEGFLIRGWDLVLPVCGATWTLARGATLATRWLYEPQPNQQPASGIGVSTSCGAVSIQGDLRLRPRFVGVVEIWQDF